MKTKHVVVLPDFRKHPLLGSAWTSRLIALLAFASPAAATAGTWDWNATTGNWNVAGNWVSESNPGTAPTSNAPGNAVNFTNGTVVAPAQATLNIDWIGGAGSSATINASNTLTLSAALILQGATSSFMNHGITQASTKGTLRGGGGTLTNNGTIQALASGTLALLGFPSIANANGEILAKSGGWIAFEGAPAITGGTLKSEVGGTILLDGGANSSQTLALNSVVMDNLGTFSSRQSNINAGSGSSTLRVNLGASTVFTNSAGALTSLNNSGSGETTSTSARVVLMNVNASATFRNNGTLLIQNDANRTGTLTGQTATFSVASDATEFSNSGTIQVLANTTGKGATALFTSEKSITNEGVVHVKGNANNEFATFSVAGADNDYTQSGNGTQRTVLERGGALSAARNITIYAGSLGGVGFVSGATTIGSNGVLFAGETFAGNAGGGTLAFSDNLTLENGAEIKLGLGVNTASSASLTLSGDLFLGTNLKLTLSELSAGDWTEGTTYRIIHLTSGTIHGDLASFSLALPTGWQGAFSSGTGFVDVTLSAIPEPSSVSLLLGSLTAMTFLLRRSRRVSSE